MVLIKIHLFGIIAALISIVSFQILAIDPDKSSDQYLLDEWNITNSLPGNNIRSIAQTPDGYLWFATSKGLIRFDGIKFHTFSIADEAGIEDEKSTFPDTLYVDKNGILWIGSLAGLTRYQYKTGQFKTFTKKEGLTKLRISRINGDIKGNIWIGFFVDYLFRYPES